MGDFFMISFIFLIFLFWEKTFFFFKKKTFLIFFKQNIIRSWEYSFVFLFDVDLWSLYFRGFLESRSKACATIADSGKLARHSHQQLPHWKELFDWRCQQGEH